MESQRKTTTAAEATTLIQRLAILHLNLALLSTGKELGETATTEENSQSILYYYHHYSNHHELLLEASETNEAIQFAGLCSALYNLPSTVVMNSNKDGDYYKELDPTQEVQLDRSTLVFIPLEEEEENEQPHQQQQQQQQQGRKHDDHRRHSKPILICVAQISKSSKIGVQDVSGGGSRGYCGGSNPLAIRYLIQRWHKLFCLLRGGGIQVRLSAETKASSTTISNSDNNDDNDDDDDNNNDNNNNNNNQHSNQCPYPGMDQFFFELKSMRRIKETMSRYNTNNNVNDEEVRSLKRKEQELTERTKNLRGTLPITYLKEDLKFHYDAMIAEVSQMTSRCSGTGRCIVECIPAPIIGAATTAEEEVRNHDCWAPGIPLPHVSFHLAQTIQDMLSGGGGDGNDERGGNLLAVSTFFQNQLVFHCHDKQQHMRAAAAATSTTFQESSSLLMSYFAFYRLKMKQQQLENQRSSSSTASSTPPGRRRISQGLVSMSLSDQISISGNVENSKNDNGGNATAALDDGVGGSFLEPPPLAMLSASDQQTARVPGPEQKKMVWAPLIYLKGICREKEDCEMAHAIFYEWNDYSFLFFVHPQALQLPLAAGEEGEVDISAGTRSLCDNTDIGNHSEEEEGISALLKRISDALTDCLNLHARVEPHPAQHLPATHQKENLNDCLKAAGQDVIYIDRTNSEMKIFPRRLATATKSSPQPASPKRFLSVFRPSNRTTTQEKDVPTDIDQETILSWVSEGMDCRHWLAARLPSEALVAFDDVINTVHTWRRQRRQEIPISGNSPDGSYEVLTTISQGWVYAFADHGHEVYILLDSNWFVTLADAHDSIMQVREALLPA